MPALQRDGPFYLFALRLVPIFPFFVINLLMGLTKIRASTFYWVSQLGMLLGTAVYVNVGTQLAQLESLRGVLSPGLLLSFVLLGVFPLDREEDRRPPQGAQGLRSMGGQQAPRPLTTTWS